MAIIMKNLWLALIFFLVESLATSFFMSAFQFYIRISKNFDKVFLFFARDIFFAFTARIYFLQIISELLIIFIIIRFDGWDKIGLIILGVFMSVVIWSCLLCVFFSFDFGIGMLQLAILKNGLPLFLGTLFAWWFCYKWLGLRV